MSLNYPRLQVGSPVLTHHHPCARNVFDETNMELMETLNAEVQLFAAHHTINTQISVAKYSNTEMLRKQEVKEKKSCSVSYDET